MLSSSEPPPGPPRFTSGQPGNLPDTAGWQIPRYNCLPPGRGQQGLSMRWKCHLAHWDRLLKTFSTPVFRNGPFSETKDSNHHPAHDQQVQKKRTRRLCNESGALREQLYSARDAIINTLIGSESSSF